MEVSNLGRPGWNTWKELRAILNFNSSSVSKARAWFSFLSLLIVVTFVFPSNIVSLSTFPSHFLSNMNRVTATQLVRIPCDNSCQSRTSLMSVYLQLVVIYNGKWNSLQVLVMKINRVAVLFMEEPPNYSQKESLTVIETCVLVHSTIRNQ